MSPWSPHDSHTWSPHCSPNTPRAALPQQPHPCCHRLECASPGCHLALSLTSRRSLPQCQHLSEALPVHLCNSKAAPAMPPAISLTLAPLRHPVCLLVYLLSSAPRRQGQVSFVHCCSYSSLNSVWCRISVQ